VNTTEAVPEAAPDRAAETRDELKVAMTAAWDHGAADYDSNWAHGLQTTVERDAWMALLERLLPRTPSLRILDVGTGTGFPALLLSELGHDVTRIDLSEGMLAISRTKAEDGGLDATFMAGDAESPPVLDSFDVVVARHVIWTLQRPESAVRAWSDLLHPGGRVIVIDGLWHPSSLSDRLLANRRAIHRPAAGRHRAPRASLPQGDGARAPAEASQDARTGAQRLRPCRPHERPCRRAHLDRRRRAQRHAARRAPAKPPPPLPPRRNPPPRRRAPLNSSIGSRRSMLLGLGAAGGCALATALAAMPAATAGAFDMRCGDTAGLVSAINAANAAGGPATIDLPPAALCRFWLTNPASPGGPNSGGDDGLPIITGNVTIRGGTITRGDTPQTPPFRVFEVAKGGNLTLAGVTVTRGRLHAPGAGIFVDGRIKLDRLGTEQPGTLTLDHSTVAGNTSADSLRPDGRPDGTEGGGVNNRGTTTLLDTTIAGNSVTESRPNPPGGEVVAAGGSLVNSGTMTITGSRIVDNHSKHERPEPRGLRRGVGQLLRRRLRRPGVPDDHRHPDRRQHDRRSDAEGAAMEIELDTTITRTRIIANVATSTGNGSPLACSFGLAQCNSRVGIRRRSDPQPGAPHADRRPDRLQPVERHRQPSRPRRRGRPDQLGDVQRHGVSSSTRNR